MGGFRFFAAPTQNLFSSAMEKETIFDVAQKINGRIRIATEFGYLKFWRKFETSLLLVLYWPRKAIPYLRENVTNFGNKRKAARDFRSCDFRVVENRWWATCSSDYLAGEISVGGSDSSRLQTLNHSLYRWSPKKILWKTLLYLPYEIFCIW